MLQVDPEFAGMLPHASAWEDEELERQIVHDGRPSDPIRVWAGHNLIVDGHRRYEICMAHGLPFTIKELQFPDKEAVKEWIACWQYSRRNVKENAARIAIAHLVASRQAEGASHREAQKDVADQQQVSVTTVKKAEKYDNVVNKLSEPAKTALNTGRLGEPSLKTIKKFARLSPEKQAELVKTVAGPVPDLAAAIKAITPSRRPPARTAKDYLADGVRLLGQLKRAMDELKRLMADNRLREIQAHLDRTDDLLTEIHRES